MGDSIYRTATKKVELLLDERVKAVDTIRIQTSLDLVTWTTRATILPRQSGASPTFGEALRGKSYFAFDPATYTLTYPFYVRMQDMDDAAIYATGPAYIAYAPGSAMYLVQEISGTAPNSATQANAQRILLPATTSFEISNTGANTLLLSVSKNGPERSITAGTTYTATARYQEIYVRCNGATNTFLLHLAQV